MAGRSKFVQALLDREFNLAEKLLADGIDIDLGHEPMGWTALHFVVENNLLESARWLLEKGANPNQKDSSGWTPLLLSIDWEGDCGQRERNIKGTFPYPAMTELLLKHGANPNAKGHSGDTPLSLAKHYRHLLAVELLIKYGATES